MTAFFRLSCKTGGMQNFDWIRAEGRSIKSAMDVSNRSEEMSGNVRHGCAAYAQLVANEGACPPCMRQVVSVLMLAAYATSMHASNVHIPPITASNVAPDLRLCK